MFEELYFHPGVIRRHREAPLAAEREAYLKQSAAKGWSGDDFVDSGDCVIGRGVFD